MIRRASQPVPAVDGHRVLFYEPVASEGAAASRKDTKAVLEMLEETVKRAERADTEATPA